MRREGCREGFREERGEEDGVWDWNSELGFGEKGREIEREREREREDSELGLWVSGLLSMILEKKLGFLLLFFII